MKKLIPGLFVLALFASGCSIKRSFMAQRYTHYKHSKTSGLVGKKAEMVQEIAAKNEEVKTELVESSMSPQAPEPMRYTQAVVNKVVKPGIHRAKKFVGFQNAAADPVKLAKTQKQNLSEKQHKRGLLWGVIDGILAIILLTVFVCLVVWLVLVLT